MELEGKKRTEKKEAQTSLCDRTGVARRNLLKAGRSNASAISHCSLHIVAVLCTYLPANNELVLHRVQIVAYHFCPRKAPSCTSFCSLLDVCRL